MSLFRRQKSRKQTNSLNKQLRMECLEQKNPLAGNVVASLDALGNLHLTGDTEGNIVLIEGLDVMGSSAVGELVVVGSTAPGEETTVNGSFSPVTFSGANTVTGDVLIDFGGGALDAIIVGNNGTFAGDVTKLPGDLIATGIDGGDTVLVANASVAGDVSLSTGAGLDNLLRFSDGTVGGNAFIESNGVTNSLQIEDGSTIAGNATIIVGGGTQVVDETIVLVKDSTVGGDLTAVSNALSSFSVVRGAEIVGDLNLTTGSGNDSFHLDRTPPVLTDLGSTVGGSLNVDSGSGIDVVVFDSLDLGVNVTISSAGSLSLTGIDTVVGNNLLISTGAGDDAVDISNFNVGQLTNGDISINTGGGNDAVNVGNFDFGQLTQSGGDLDINTGAGIDAVFVLNVDMLGDFTFDAGDGDDFIGAEFINVGGNLLASLGLGINEASIGLGSVGGSLVVTGTGQNLIELGDLTVANAVIIVTSNQADEIGLENVSANFALILGGGDDDLVVLADSAFDNVFVLLGRGDDALVIEGDLSVTGLALFSGGSGVDTLDTSQGTLDAGFLLDLAFEVFEIA